MKKVLAMALGLFTGLMMITPATAATVALDFTVPTEALDMPDADATTGLVHQNIIGTDNVNLYYRSPFEGTSLADGKFTAVRANSSATYDLGTSTNKVEFVWGSVDSFNLVKFYQGTTLVDFITGGTVIGEGATSGSGFAQVMIMANSLFDRIEFSSSQNAFEIGNLKISVVPLPAALPLYGAGIALLGFLGWRKRRSA
ncbi:hypothetical protein GUA87_04295 [Sneathiella sp. P13V-1]|uniref:Npun_F0296 family exosortase-dependent surface protein n=1 Tax=Sneathiella sp. P13V-1 TaxID=2697366 RepID=UPI00187B5D45|nr:hypothetical protein [Sneathiella sp. P13V-1]MBE7636052.1 hypothetical protein [Sneathiella sp. P13V-1]